MASPPQGPLDAGSGKEEPNQVAVPSCGKEERTPLPSLLDDGPHCAVPTDASDPCMVHTHLRKPLLDDLAPSGRVLHGRLA